MGFFSELGFFLVNGKHKHSMIKKVVKNMKSGQKKNVSLKRIDLKLNIQKETGGSANMTHDEIVAELVKEFKELPPGPKQMFLETPREKLIQFHQFLNQC